MRKRYWTLAAVVALGGTAAADDVETHDDYAASGVTLSAEMGTSYRGFADNTLVMPAGGELGASMRFLTSQPMFGEEPVRFSDIALFGISGRWSLHKRFELSAGVELLPKQPSYTDEKPFQSASLGIRTPLGKRAAVGIAGAGGHLINHTGMWLQQALVLEWRKEIAEVVHFDLGLGASNIALTAPGAESAFLTEGTIAFRAVAHAPNNVWGGWIGFAYALPVLSNGEDPTTGMELDPQPRLDVRVGNVVAVTKQWDLVAELAVVDRGDLSDARTRLPILNGGFDQIQVIFGVTRHFEGRSQDPYSALQMSQR
jgi:hypothetical protein